MSAAITDISSILTSSDPLQDKVGKVRDTVQQRVNPLLEVTSARVQEILASLRGKAAAEKQQAVAHENGNGSANGNGHA